MNTIETNGDTAVTTHPVSPAQMVEALLDLGKTAHDIEQQLGVASGFVVGALQDRSLVSTTAEVPVLSRLWRLFLREKLKGIYRRTSCIGPQKAAKRLGVSLDEFREVQGKLLESGQIKRATTKPSWRTTDERQSGIAEYTVED